MYSHTMPWKWLAVMDNYVLIDEPTCYGNLGRFFCDEHRSYCWKCEKCGKMYHDSSNIGRSKV